MMENFLEGCIISNSNQHKVVKAYHYFTSKDHHKKWAIPGTKKQLAADTNEPTSAVPLQLESASHANSSQPSDTKSAQSSHANSSKLPHIDSSLIASGTDDNCPKIPQVDTVDVEHSKTLQSDNNNKKMPFNSQASNTAYNPGFDNGNASSPVPDTVEAPAEGLESDTTLLPQDYLEISQHQSEYEHSGAYNMIWNKKLWISLT